MFPHQNFKRKYFEPTRTLINCILARDISHVLLPMEKWIERAITTEIGNTTTGRRSIMTRILRIFETNLHARDERKTTLRMQCIRKTGLKLCNRCGWWYAPDEYELGLSFSWTLARRLRLYRSRNRLMDQAECTYRYYALNVALVVQQEWKRKSLTWSHA